MGLKELLSSEIKASMKAGNRVRTGVLRMVLSEIKYAQAAVDARQQLSDEESLKVVSTYHKRLEKSLEDFPPGEKREAIQLEIEIVNSFLPKKASQEEVATVIDKLLASSSDRTFGPLMKEALAALGSAADGKVVSQILREKLANS